MRDTTERFMSLVLGCLLGAVMVFGGFTMAARSADEEEDDQPGRFVVSGDGLVRAKPDIFKVTFQVEGKGATATEAQTQLQTRMTRLLTKMTQLGVQDADLATGMYNLRSLYGAQQRQSSKIPRFVVRNSLEVTIRQVDHAGQFLDAAIAVGAESIDVHGFEIEDLRRVRNEARSVAAKNARERAELIATSSGAQLGRVLTISETPPPGYDVWGQRSQNYYRVPPYGEPTAPTDAAAMGVVTGLEDAMEPGLTEVTATIYVEFELL